MPPKQDAKAKAREQAQAVLKERKEKEAKAAKAATALRKQKKEEAALCSDTLKLLREVRELGNDPELNQATDTFKNLITSTKIEEIDGRAVVTATADIEPCHSKVPAGEYFGTHLARANDGATPDWKKLIIDQKGEADLDQMMKIWEEYREKSEKAANYKEGVPVCVNELMGAYYVGHLRDKNHPSEPSVRAPAWVEILRPIKAGEEVCRSYDFIWLVMSYQHLCATIDQWDAGQGIIWRLLDQDALKFSGMGCMSEHPPDHSGEGEPLKPNQVWTSKNQTLKYTKLLRRFFIHLFKTLPTPEEKTRAKTVFNGIVVRVCMPAAPGHKTCAKHVMDLKCV